MSYVSVSAGVNGNLTRSTSIGNISMGWVKQLSYALLTETAFQVKGLLGNAGVATVSGIFLAITSGLSNQQVLPTFDDAWLFFCLQNTGALLNAYWRCEGDTALQSASISFVGITYSNAYIFTDLLAGQDSNSKITAYKEWDTGARLSSAQILQESQSVGAVNATGLSNSLSCQIGSSVGVDDSGNSHNWTVSGTVAIDSDEPNMAIVQPAGVVSSSFFMG